MARRICGADDADIKKMIFINFLMISAVGILIGFIVTLLLTLILPFLIISAISEFPQDLYP